jgi:hypothetical protein
VVSKYLYNNFIRPLIVSGLILVSHCLFSQVNIKVVDEENNPIQFVQAFNKNTGALISTSSYDGSINIKDKFDTLTLFHYDFIEKTLPINTVKQNVVIALERKDIVLKEIEVIGNPSKSKTLIMEAYVRNYIMENDSLTGYLDAIVEYAISADSKENNTKSFLKEYRVFSQKIVPKKRRWLELSFSNGVSVPKMKTQSILETQKENIKIKEGIIYLKKDNDSITGNINLKDNVLQVQMDRSVGDKSLHNFLGYRIRFLYDIRTENYNYSSFDILSEIPEIKKLISTNSYQKILIKHKKDDNFNVVELFTDIIILKCKYIDTNGLKTIKKQKISREKSIYYDPFWIDYTEDLPAPVKEKLKTLNELK